MNIQIVYFKIGFIIFAGIAISERIVEIVSHRKDRGEITGPWSRHAMVACHLLFFFGSLLELLVFKNQINILISFLGVICFIGGFGLRKWVIHTLGELWSINVEMFPNHELIIRGPYQYYRHPNYLAILFELIGFCLIANAYIALIISFIAYSIVLYLRIRIEESELIKRFDQEYVHYKLRTAALIPFLI